MKPSSKRKRRRKTDDDDDYVPENSDMNELDAEHLNMITDESFGGRGDEESGGEMELDGDCQQIDEDESKYHAVTFYQLKLKMIGVSQLMLKLELK